MVRALKVVLLFGLLLGAAQADTITVSFTGNTIAGPESFTYSTNSLIAPPLGSIVPQQCATSIGQQCQVLFFNDSQIYFLYSPDSGFASTYYYFNNPFILNGQWQLGSAEPWIHETYGDDGFIWGATGTLTITSAPVPEPSTLALLGSGLIGAFMRRSFSPALSRRSI